MPIDPKNDFARGDVGVTTNNTGIEYASDSQVSLSSASSNVSSDDISKFEQTMLDVGQALQQITPQKNLFQQLADRIAE